MSSTFFISVGTCCSWSTTSRLPWSRASIFNLFYQSINALLWPFLSWEFFYYSCAVPAFLSEACFNHRSVAVTEHHLLWSGLPKWDSCTSYLKQIASLMSYWNVTFWHVDIQHLTADTCGARLSGAMNQWYCRIWLAIFYDQPFYGYLMYGYKTYTTYW